MAGFNSNEFFTTFRYKLLQENPSLCTIGRYVIPKDSDFPYLDFSIKEIEGKEYDTVSEEGSKLVVIDINVYAIGTIADTTCENICLKSKDMMNRYGFQCKSGPIKTDNADVSIARWTCRFKRLFGNADILQEVQ